MMKLIENKRPAAGWMMAITILLLMFTLLSCGGEKKEADGAPEIAGLTFQSEEELDYAEGFHIYDYSDGYQLIDVTDTEKGNSVKYLLIPEEGRIPDEVSEDITILEKPLDQIYLAASAAMALISAVDGMDSVAFTATEEKDWYLEDAAKAMKEGRIKYAGKYSQPDYEMLLDEGCDLAVESTMILHSPSVQEKLEGLDIPVFVDQSSYESHPLGRSEWVKVYGALLDKGEQARAFFDEQKKIISDLGDIEDTGRTVAFFYLNSQDQAVVRASDDYIPKMIEIAGGRYIFEDVKNPNEDSRNASVRMSMEEFYDKARDADYLIYNATIESPLRTVDDLTEKSDLFTKFKAVKEGNVWTTDKYLYQATDIMGQLIGDMHNMLTGGDESKMVFLKKVPGGGDTNE